MGQALHLLPWGSNIPRMMIPILAAVLLVLGLVLYFADRSPKLTQLGYLCIGMGLLGLVLTMTRVIAIH